MIKKTDFDYELIDCGGGIRVENFGGIIVERPCPPATWTRKIKYEKPDVLFSRSTENAEWKNPKKLLETWEMKIGKIHAEIRLSKNGQVGIFPEQFENWKWISEKIKAQKDRPLKILNLFAYTGMATLFASEENTEVCHVDGASSSVNWAKKNAELSGMNENQIRWICDDVMKFMIREIRRGNKYDGIILDPPAFGRGDKKDWKIEKDLPELMKMVKAVLSENPVFVVLTCHAPKHFSKSDLANMLEKLTPFKGKTAEKLDLTIPSPQGNPLFSSFGARIC
jgi:23S rRNA (cytosine1962-C5)-methyltransferase